jgi:hypothetical protein
MQGGEHSGFSKAESRVTDEHLMDDWVFGRKMRRDETGYMKVEKEKHGCD